MKIKSIYIDGLHNAVNKTYDFGDINYIFGNNGIGKSTILQAIQFALLGYIPGTAKNSKEALLRHSPKGKIEVTISLTDTENDSDIIINRRITAKTTEVNIIPSEVCISDIIKDIELPIFNFNEFVSQTANKLKDYFIKNILPTSDGALDWPKILTDAVEDCNFQDKDAILQYGMALITGIADTEPDMLSQVVKANAIFKEDMSFKKAELQRLQNTVDSLIFYDNYTGPTDVNELNAQLLEAGSLRDQVIKYNAAVAATQTTTEELDKLRKDLAAMGGSAFFDECNAQLPVLKKVLEDLKEAIDFKRTELSLLKAKNVDTETVIQSNGICPYTRTNCVSIQAKISELQETSDKRKADILSLTEEISCDNDTAKGVMDQITTCEANINLYVSMNNRIAYLEMAIHNLPDKPSTDKDVFALDQEIAALTQSKEQLQANIKYNETIDNITKLKYETELQLTALNKWAKITDTNGLQTTIMEAPFKELANTMTGYIQQMYDNTDLAAHFNISSKANSFSFGLIRDGVYIPYDLLSSGEKCLYTLALMICIANTNKSPLKLLLCDDMFDHLDAKSIESTFATLKNVPGIQFIFAGVKECNNAKDILITV